MTNFINQNSAIFRASLALNPQRGPGVAPRGAAQYAGVLDPKRVLNDPSCVLSRFMLEWIGLGK